MIPLTDPIWNSLSWHDVSGSEFAAILATYYGGEIPPYGDELLEDLAQCSCGGDLYSSAVVAAEHLVKLTTDAELDAAAAMLGVVAHAVSDASTIPLPDDPRILSSLRNAQTRALAIVDRVHSGARNDHPERPYFEATRIGLTGDSERFWNEIENVTRSLYPDRDD